MGAAGGVEMVRVTGRSAETARAEIVDPAQGRRRPGPQKVFRLNPGPQSRAAASRAEFLIFGGGAGGGKTHYLLLDPTRHLHVPGFTGMIFRRTFPMIALPGGLWQKSNEIYRPLGGVSNRTAHSWEWVSGASMTFSHMQYEDDKLNHQGGEYAFIGFDELTHFTRSQVFYLLSRNRSICGVDPYSRGTCNPDADSWVRPVVDWWIDNDTGYPIPERSGKIRWMIELEDGGELKWFDSAADARHWARANMGEDAPDPKSVTFIPALVEDNPVLMEKDPKYVQKLNALGKVDRERLRRGNWNIRYTKGNVFRRDWVRIVDAAPAGLRMVRYWDRAATEGAGDFTVGALLGMAPDGRVFILDVIRGQWSAGKVREMIRAAAGRDGRGVEIWIEQEPGSSGKADAESIIAMLSGFVAHADKKTGAKIDLAKPLSAQMEAGNVAMVRAPWNNPLISELEGFTGDNKGGAHDDQVDAISGAFDKLAAGKTEVLIL